MKRILSLLILLAASSYVIRAQNGASSSPSPDGASSSVVGTTNLDQETRELKPRDVLRYTIEEDVTDRGGFFPPVTITELGDAQFQVSSGTQTYVNIKAAGRKLAEIRKELKEKLDADYYRDSTIRVDLSATAPPKLDPGASTVMKAIVYGAMNATIPLSEERKKTLSEAFASMGAQNQYANLRKVEIYRQDPVSKQPVKLIKNVKKMLEEGDLKEDIELLDGDRIHVVERVLIGL